MQHKCSVEGPRSQEKEETLLSQALQSFVGEVQPISASLEGKGLVVTFFFSFFLVVAILFKAKKATQIRISWRGCARHCEVSSSSAGSGDKHAESLTWAPNRFSGHSSPRYVSNGERGTVQKGLDNRLFLGTGTNIYRINIPEN